MGTLLAPERLHGWGSLTADRAQAQEDHCSQAALRQGHSIVNVPVGDKYKRCGSDPRNVKHSQVADGARVGWPVDASAADIL